MSLKKKNILIVDDNYDMLDLMQRHLKGFNYNTYKASSANEAIEVLKYASIDLLITDLNMPDTNGFELIKYSKEHYPILPTLIITGMPTIENAVNAIKTGASDYLVKPFTSDELYQTINRSVLKNTNDSYLSNPVTSVSEEINYAGIDGRSEQFKNLVDIIERVKNNKVNVLIEGESGTGKELIARAIHTKGSLANMPFICINCGGIPETLIESELFGHTKGAFTGAKESRIGLFQAASGGTIFLDEIGNAPLFLQTKLLRVIQEKEITKIGAVNTEKIDVRIICATNSDLHKMVLDGTFREDLYYRINVINIKTTPLRERKEDIIFLVNTFIKKYAIEYHKPSIKINEKINDILLRYSWPGNIRELENIIQRMIIMTDDIIDLQHVPKQLKYHIPEKTEPFKSLREYEKDQILKILAAVDNNKTKAAKILQIDRKTLNQKII
ncbi:sigma-54 dependent transcriptional regulator [Flavobacterium sp. MC2016-06]|uniref:sigma-54-dependent transcriptional regulator n=1 Tax=Flavobacterium sp. MC2016-06 TaxID=2676308 RepID=UPI0012BAE6C9|nr:sigma-54 dependent transcriptional regulator [Flavobacterium sp. MC2016-06]MBU3859674.1 sigma-54 dependent transcriptional regulator [Flavobacterium sp. MC2016-06]